MELWLLLLFSSLLTTEVLLSTPIRHNVTSLRSGVAELPCEVSIEECGNFFSIEWYDAISHNRLYAYRHHSGMARAEHRWRERARHSYDSRRHIMSLSLSQLTLSDQGYYRCEITYEEEGRWFGRACLSSATQITHLSVWAPPQSVQVLLANGTQLANNRELGPLLENETLSLKCLAHHGRPVASVQWLNESRPISPAWHRQVEHENGTGTASSEIHLTLNRFHHRQRLRCALNSLAIEASHVDLDQYLVLDMDLPPISLAMVAEDTEDVVEGGRVHLVCQADKAKPPAYIYWNSEPELDLQDVHEEVTPNYDHTFKTVNRLSFRADRRLTSVSCFASNRVLDDTKAVHLRQDATINVKFMPVVKSEFKVIEGVEGDQVRIFCHFEANPMAGAVVNFYHDNRLIETKNGENDNHVYSTEDEDVLVMQVVDHVAGVYSCAVENVVGQSEIVQLAEVIVLKRPDVSLAFHPDQVVSETKNANVTLRCVAEEKTKPFLAVKWYLDGELLKHIHRPSDCLDSENINNEDDKEENRESSHSCQVDPSQILLINVKRSFLGNYSCRGRNEAGWGPMSGVRQLKVLYPPSKPFLVTEPEIVLKGEPFKLICGAEEPGYPAASQASWYHENRKLRRGHASSLELKMDAASVESAGNYSCQPFNEAGNTLERATKHVEVYTKPTFVRQLPIKTGAPYTQSTTYLTCTVECDPVCSILWYRNDLPINSTTNASSVFTVRSNVYKADLEQNLLLHITSTLEMSKLNKALLKPEVDKANYSCRSTANAVGPSVMSQTEFNVNFPPRRISVEPGSQSVQEGATLLPWQCRAEGYPPPTFTWSTPFSDQIVRGESFHMRHAISRDHAGVYTCVASNSLGNVSASVPLSVFFAPSCRLRKELLSSSTAKVFVLRCDVEAEPRDNISYSWFRNNRLLPNANRRNLRLAVQQVESFSCQASNAVGQGHKCSIKVGQPVVHLSDNGDLGMIVIFGFVGVVVALLVVVLLAISCRKGGPVVSLAKRPPQLDEHDIFDRNEHNSNMGNKEVDWPRSDLLNGKRTNTLRLTADLHNTNNGAAQFATLITNGVDNRAVNRKDMWLV